MKIISKAYLLITILILAAALNLFLFYQDSNSQTTQSYSIIKVGDVKVTSESIAALSTSVANGNLQDKEELDNQVEKVESIINVLENGGTINHQVVEKIPASLISDYGNLKKSWETYKDKIKVVEATPVFDQEATNALNYVLQKNNDLVLLADQITKELESLNRDYSRHKEISNELLESSKIIGQQTLLISIGEDDNAQEKLKEKRLEFEIGLRKLSLVSTSDLDVKSVEKEHEELIPLPRENSEALRQIDPLWESMQSRIIILEDRAMLSPEFSAAKEEMEINKESLYSNVDKMLQNWSVLISNQGSEEQTIIQIILVIDIAIFFLVLFVIRQSLTPLASITNALTRVKDGVYGEKINYSSSDEVGQLVNNFNIMSNTIKEKEEEAKKTDVAKDEFLAMITHELKTPLVPIQGYSDILLHEHLGKLTDKQKERINIIKSSSETLLSMISDLLDAQKLDLGQLKMIKEKSDIKDTIMRAINTLKPQSEENNIEIISNPTSLIIEHDSKRIEQVITNLIKNSIVAIQPNPGKIEVLMYDTPKNIKISIKDNGVGIQQEKQKDLFKKFYQVDATLTRERGGSGLGLAICKGIIDNHFGEITVESIPNQGSTFSFTIPKESSESVKSPLNSA